MSRRPASLWNLRAALAQDGHRLLVLRRRRLLGRAEPGRRRGGRSPGDRPRHHRLRHGGGLQRRGQRDVAGAGAARARRPGPGPRHLEGQPRPHQPGRAARPLRGQPPPPRHANGSISTSCTGQSTPAIRHFTSDEALLRQPPDVGEAFATLADLRREGKIRYLGVSNFGVEQLAEARATGAELAANELPYNLLMRGIEPALLPECARQGIGVHRLHGAHAGRALGRVRSPLGRPDPPSTSCPPPAPACATSPASARARATAGPASSPRPGRPCRPSAPSPARPGCPSPIWRSPGPWPTRPSPPPSLDCRTAEQLEDNVRACSNRPSARAAGQPRPGDRPHPHEPRPHVDYFQSASDSRCR